MHKLCPKSIEPPKNPNLTKMFSGYILAPYDFTL